MRMRAPPRARAAAYFEFDSGLVVHWHYARDMARPACLASDVNVAPVDLAPGAPTSDSSEHAAGVQLERSSRAYNSYDVTNRAVAR